MDETSDEELTALLDGRLPERQRAEAISRLAADSALQSRFDALARARAPLDDAFALMLSEAPVARLRASLGAADRPARPRQARRALLAASLALLALFLGGLAYWLGATRDSDDWTDSVVDYARLYTRDTFAGLAPNAALEAAILQHVGTQLGLAIGPEALAAAGLHFKTAFVLSYEGVPLGEYVFADDSGAPYLFCVLAEGATPSPVRQEQRQSFWLAVWNGKNHRFLVIGPASDRVRDWSSKLARAT